jgi:hypothetical protein
MDKDAQSLKPGVTVAPQISACALFGALWGIIETVLGTALHAAHVPFRGLILSCVATVVLVCTKEFARYRGSLVMTGAVAMAIKGLSGGGLVFNPMLAIFLESVIAESIFSLFGIRRLSALVAGSLVVLYTYLHGILAQGVFFGFDIYTVYARAVALVIGTTNVDASFVWRMLLLLAACHIFLGVVAAWFGWNVAQRTRTLLQEELS